MIRYAPGTDHKEIRSSLTALDNLAAFQDANAIYNFAQSYMALFYVFVGVMLAFGAAMSFALIFNSMSVNIAERRREIATMLAVGMERRNISQLITAENMLENRGAAYGVHRSLDHFGAVLGPLVAAGLLWIGLGLRWVFSSPSSRQSLWSL